MFFRFIILTFVLNTLIPSAMALNGIMSNKVMQTTVSEEFFMSDMSKNKMFCISHIGCNMMDMDNCDTTQCSTSGYLNTVLVSVIFYPNSMRQPHFILSHFYHIVHPVHTPPPLA